MIYVHVLNFLGKINCPKSQAEIISWLKQENNSIQIHTRFHTLPNGEIKNTHSISGYYEKSIAVSWDMVKKKPIPQYSYIRVW